MKMLQSIDKMNTFVANVVCWTVILSMLSIIFEIIMRYVAHSPTRWVSELNGNLLCLYILLGGGYTLLIEGHVKVDVIYERLTTKNRAILDIVTSIVFFAFIGVLVWQAAEMTISSIEMKRRSSGSMQWPLWPIQTAIAVGAFLMLLQGIAKLARDIIILRKSG